MFCVKFFLLVRARNCRKVLRNNTNSGEVNVAALTFLQYRSCKSSPYSLLPYAVWVETNHGFALTVEIISTVMNCQFHGATERAVNASFRVF